jgi:hypothetical protein
MSVGHARPHTNESHLRELVRIESQPWFRRAKAIRKILDRSHDIPWLGGSSTDLRRIYADPKFSGVADYLGRAIPIKAFIRPLVDHEETEGILLVFGTDERGQRYDYDGAHEIATCAEERTARRVVETVLGLRWDRDAYQEIYKPILAITVKPPWPNIPADLNTEPYREDDPDLYRQVEGAILHAIALQAAGGKMSKSQADYSPGKPNAHCGICEHYENRSCELVAGPIDPAMWCRLFLRGSDATRSAPDK